MTENHSGTENHTGGAPAGPDERLLRDRLEHDTGHRTSLDDAIIAFGYTRTELEAELEAERAANQTTQRD